MTSLLDLMRAPMVRVPVDPDGQVVQGDVADTLTLPHPRLAWPSARIELHPHGDLWMWSVSLHFGDCGGSSYRVGSKWGRFAASRDDALHYAVQELTDCVRTRGIHHPDVGRIICWAGGLR